MLIEELKKLIQKTWQFVFVTIAATLVFMLLLGQFILEQKNVLYALIITIIAIVVLNIVWLKEWYKSKKIQLFDYLIIGVPTGIFFYFSLSRLSCWFVFLGLSWFIGVYFLLTKKLLQSGNNPEDNKKSDKQLNSHLYFEVFGNDEPINKVEEDELKRGQFIKSVAEHIVNYPKKNINIGINGAWGMGKTSLLNCVVSYLKTSKKKCETVFFSSWHYRESNNILYHLLQNIENVLLKECGSDTKIKNYFKKITKNLNSISIKGVGVNLGYFFNRDDKADLTTIIENKFLSHLLVFIDDIDRLDRGEVIAIFRAIRQLSDLPKIRFILAYDNQILAKQLFPDDASGNMTRDYISKIIQQEFNLCIPSKKTRHDFMNKLYKKHQEIEGILDQFFEIKYDNKFQDAVFNLLITPREIKRILAATVFIYYLHNENKQLNYTRYDFVDLFLLSILQYKAPKVYYNLQVYKDKITKSLTLIGSDDADKEIKNDNSNLIGKLTSCQDVSLCKENDDSKQSLEGSSVKIILDYLLKPNNIDKHITLLQSRRMCHPNLYYTYFKYSEPDSMPDLYEFASELGKLENIEKLKKDISILSLFLKKYNSELQEEDYWDLFCEHLKKILNHKKPVSIPVCLMIIKYLEKIADETQERDWKRSFSFRAYNLIYEFICKNKNDNKSSVIEVLNKFLNEANSYFFLSFLVKIVIDPNQFHYKSRIIEGISEEDKNDLNEKLCSKFNELYIDKQILDIGYYDLVGLFAWTTMDDELKNKTKNELQKTPNKIFSILDIFLTIDEAGIFSSINNLAQLDKQISCKELYDIVKDKVAIDNDRKKESQLELLKEHSSV